MPLFLVMSISGSIATIIYFLLEPIAKRIFPVEWRKNCLLCNMLCYLIPFPLWGWGYKCVLKDILGLNEKQIEYDLYQDITSNVIQISPNGIGIQGCLVYFFLGVMFLIGMLNLYTKLRKYRNVKKYCANGQRIEYEELYVDEEVKKILKEKKIDIFMNSFMNTPFTLGVKRITIIMPQREWKRQEFEDVIMHEIVHIKNRDNLFKCILLVLVMLNFYNPFAYYFALKWNDVIELMCDDKVIANKNREEIKQYATMIINMMAENRESDWMPIEGFSFNNRGIEERIINMKKDKKKYSGINLSLGIGVIVVAMFLASLSVLAYEPKQIEIVEEISDSIIVSYEELAWGEEGIYTGDNIEEGWQVVCDDGEIRQLPNEYFEVQEARICFHEYVVCKITKHTTQSGGGCILKIYDGEECSKCNKVKMGELYSTMSFPQCPH